MALEANHWLNISVKTGTNTCGSLKYTSLGKPRDPGDLFSGDLLQHITDFTFSNQTLTGSRFRTTPKAGEVG